MVENDDVGSNDYAYEAEDEPLNKDDDLILIPNDLYELLPRGKKVKKDVEYSEEPLPVYNLFELSFSPKKNPTMEESDWAFVKRGRLWMEIKTV